MTSIACCLWPTLLSHRTAFQNTTTGSLVLSVQTNDPDDGEDDDDHENDNRLTSPSPLWTDRRAGTLWKLKRLLGSWQGNFSIGRAKPSLFLYDKQSQMNNQEKSKHIELHLHDDDAHHPMETKGYILTPRSTRDDGIWFGSNALVSSFSGKLQVNTE